MTTGWGNVQSAINPRTFGDLALWLDGADPAGNGIIPANNTPISTWVDKSTRGFNFSQVTGSSQPLYKTNVVGTKGAVFFDGANDYLERAYESFLNDQNQCFLIVCSTNILDDNFRSPVTSRYGPAPFDNLRGYYSYVTATSAIQPSSFTMIFGGGSGPWNNVDDGTATLNTKTLLSFYCPSTTAQFFVNNTSVGTATYIPETVTFNSEIRIGAGNTGSSASFFWSGHIYEVVSYRLSPSSANYQSIRNYLIQKWGI